MRSVVRRLRSLIQVIVLIAGVAEIVSPAMASAIAITPFPLQDPVSEPIGITTGPDGALWFTAAEYIGRITPSGIVTAFPLPTAGVGPVSGPLNITTGPDGNLWFTEVIGNRIGRITPAGVITEFTVPTPDSRPGGIAAGPDGNLWFTEADGNKIGRITPAGVITEFPIPTPDSAPSDITLGPDGGLWFTETRANKIGRITQAGVFTEFPIPLQTGETKVPAAITVGPDGALWFTETINRPGAITIAGLGRISTAGNYDEFPLPTFFSSLSGITAGPDGALWFTELTKIGRITPVGLITEFPLTTRGTGGITVGPDGAVWFAESDADRISRIVVTAVLSLSPTSGLYVTTQQFDPTLILASGPSVVGGRATFDGLDATVGLARCGIPGRLLAGGQTLRCPNPGHGTLSPGTHTFGVALGLADGSSLSGGVTWQLLANSEP